MPKLKRKIVVSGSETFIRMEEEFWTAFDEICRTCGVSPSEFATVVDRNKGEAPLSSALTIAIISYYREMMKAIDVVRSRSLRSVTEIAGDPTLYGATPPISEKENGENGDDRDNGDR